MTGFEGREDTCFQQVDLEATLELRHAVRVYAVIKQVQYFCS